MKNEKLAARTNKEMIAECKNNIENGETARFGADFIPTVQYNTVLCARIFCCCSWLLFRKKRATRHLLS